MSKTMDKAQPNRSKEYSPKAGPKSHGGGRNRKKQPLDRSGTNVISRTYEDRRQIKEAAVQATVVALEGKMPSRIGTLKQIKTIAEAFLAGTPLGQLDGTNWIVRAFKIELRYQWNRPIDELLVEFTESLAA